MSIPLPESSNTTSFPPPEQSINLRKGGCHCSHKIDSPFYYFFFLFDFFFVVEILKRTYRGQKPTRLVRKKITARMPRMMARVPDMFPVR
jgi:hypothetical protein